MMQNHSNSALFTNFTSPEQAPLPQLPGQARSEQVPALGEEKSVMHQTQMQQSPSQPVRQHGV